VLYIDSPAGTGFSYTPGQQGPYTTDDGATIGDLQVLVAGFFRQHPELARLPLYIAGGEAGGGWTCVGAVL
jgi:carboxypeptidase C (cathepsin A)